MWKKLYEKEYLVRVAENGKDAWYGGRTLGVQPKDILRVYYKFTTTI